MRLISGVDHDVLMKLAEKEFGGMPGSHADVPKLEPCRFTGSEVGRAAVSETRLDTFFSV